MKQAHKSTVARGTSAPAIAPPLTSHTDNTTAPHAQEGALWLLLGGVLRALCTETTSASSHDQPQQRVTRLLFRSAGVAWRLSLAHLLRRRLVLHFEVVVLDRHCCGWQYGEE